MKIRDGRSMANMVTNVYVKSNYDRLRIDKASETSEVEKQQQQRRKYNVHID